MDSSWKRSPVRREAWELLEYEPVPLGALGTLPTAGLSAAYLYEIGYLIKKKNKRTCRDWRVFVTRAPHRLWDRAFIGELSNVSPSEAQSAARLLINVHRRNHHEYV